MKLATVILAAGESSRLGRPKQLLPWGKKTLLQHVIDTARAVSSGPVVVVLGGHLEKIRPSLDATQVQIAINPEWAAGLGGSIRAGINQLIESGWDPDAILFLVCDQPRLETEHLRQLFVAFEASGNVLAAAEYGGKYGVPAVFGRQLFPELLVLRGAEGARKIIDRHREKIVGTPFPGGTEDIDTPGDFIRLLQDPRGKVALLPD